MRNSNSVLTIRVPFELKHRIEQVADIQGVSMNQFALYAFTKEIAELETKNQISKYYIGKDKTEILSDFDSVMNKIQKKRVPDWDKTD
jgi:hypothetical protein